MLTIHLPLLTSEGLRYGDIGTGTKDRECLRVWRAIGRDFLRRTSGGLWGVFPRPVKCITFDPKFRYSPGAAELLRSGVHLLGAGIDTWHIEEPKTRRSKHP
jgi:hypothetical protein